MKPDQNRICEVFAEALVKTSVAEREKYLSEICRDEPELREQVDSLLAAHEQAGQFLASALPAETKAKGALGTVRYIGDYELQEEIGRGGMGVVFRARQASLNRAVAVKMILSGEYAGSSERVRFRREAEAAAQLRHPNIVSIHEVGEHEGRSYYSMDYIEGRSLSEVLKDGKMPPARAAALVKTLAEAVHFAHQRGTLHRDLKPQNILMGADGQPHILDFGLARPIQQETKLTRTGDIMGSPSYMPPEQATGKLGEIGPASDVYALGAILYEAITGSPPFTGESPVDVLSRVINQEPIAPRRRNSGVPADLETICLKCLEKRPERRYHSAQALADELERFLNFEPVLARPASPFRKLWSWTQRNPWVFVAGFGLAALVFLCAAYGFWEQTQFLNWRLQSAKPTPSASKEDFSFTSAALPPIQPINVSRSEREMLAPLFTLLSPVYFLFLNAVGHRFRKYHFQLANAGVNEPDNSAAYQAAAGGSAFFIGMAYLLLHIRFWTWAASERPSGVEILAVLNALGLISMGARMVWEAVGTHETSRYRHLVTEFLARQWAQEPRRWRLFESLGVAWWIYALWWMYSFFTPVEYTTRSKIMVATFLLGSMILTSAIAALFVWAGRTRRRLVIVLGVPAMLAGDAFALFTLPSGLEPIVFFWINVYIAGQVVATLYLLGRSKAYATTKSGRFPYHPFLDLGYGMALAFALGGLIRWEENWRGRVDWEKCQRQQEARGLKLDWKIPPPIPDDQNVFKAPKMQEWFVGHGESPFVKLLKEQFPFSGSNGLPHDVTVATVRLVAPGDPISEGSILLRSNGTNVKAQTAALISQVTGPVMSVPQNFPVISKAPAEISPVKIALECSRTLAASNVAACFPTRLNGWANMAAIGNLRIDADGPLAFRVVAVNLCSASEIIAAEEKCEPTLDVVRQALKRPLARMEGDYSLPPKIPVPNYIAMRVLSQILCASAEADFLRQNPQHALRQLTFMRDALRLTASPPGGQPETMVASMTKVAITGLYAGTIGDGLRLRIWDDEQLGELQRQLADTELLTDVEHSFQSVANWVRAIDILTERGQDYMSEGLGWSGISSGQKLLCKMMPGGWWKQNEVYFVEAFPLVTKTFDLHNHTIDALQLKQAIKTWEANVARPAFAAFTIYRNSAIPNFIRAGATTAHNQTLVNQACIACALERYRLAHNEYPETLDILIPQYLDKIPHDTIGGQPPVYRRGTNGGFELSSVGWDEKERWNWPPHD